MKDINFEDMILLQKDRKSSKNLEHVNISNKLETMAGQVRKGYSIPKEQLEMMKTQGKGTYHKREYTDMKDII